MSKSQQQIEYAERSKFQFNASNYRKSMIVGGIEELTASVAEKFILEPLHVRRIPDTDRMVVVNGNRRLVAIERSGRTDPIPYIDLGDISELEGEEHSLVVNLQCEQPNLVDTARGIQRYMKLGGYSLADACKRLGLKTSRISKWLAILQLPDELLAKLSAGEATFNDLYSQVRKPHKNTVRRKRSTLRASGLTLTLLHAAGCTVQTLRDMLAPIMLKLDDMAPEAAIDRLVR